MSDLEMLILRKHLKCRWEPAKVTSAKGISFFIHAVSRPQFNSIKASQSYMKSVVGNPSFFYGLLRYNDGVPTDNLRVPKDRF